MIDVLDVGCGSSGTGEIRVDIKRDSLANVLADAQCLPFKDESSSLVFSSNVLEHIPDWRKAVKEMCRVSSRKILIEVPVNSDLRKIDGFRILVPTLNNLRLLRALPERAREHLWQFKPEILAAEVARHGFMVTYYQKNSLGKSFLSRVWIVEGIKKRIY